MAPRSEGASRQISSSTALLKRFAVWAAHTGAARTRRLGFRNRRACTAARAVTPVASPSSTRIAVRPTTSGSGLDPPEVAQPPPYLRELLSRDLLDVVVGDAETPDHVLVEDAHAAGRDGPDAELWLVRRP